MRHATELYNLLLTKETQLPILCLYTDGGPDHRLTYLRVQLSYIMIFLALDLDYFVAVRTPPSHSWKNPVERIMSVLNLGLQSVGLMQAEMEKELGDIISNCSTMQEIREMARKRPELKKAVIQSLKPVKKLLQNVFCRQSLKGEPFTVFEAASDEEIAPFFEKIWLVDQSLLHETKSFKDIQENVSNYVYMHYYYVITTL